VLCSTGGPQDAVERDSDGNAGSGHPDTAE
jgi:hypothetical protein